MAIPMPWPVYSRTTENPAPSATPCTAAPMSDSRPPGTIAAMPAASDASVTWIRRSSSGPISPTPAVKAASPCHPSTIAPQSMETMSPSSSRTGPGTPWTMTSFGEAQITPEKGGWP